MKSATFNPVEIGFNPLKDLLAFTWTEFLSKPFNRIAIFLVVVTSLLSVAKWNYIRWNCTRTIRIGQWYPMILGNGMPESARSTADGTTPIEIIKGTLPIARGERTRQIESPSAAIMGMSFSLFGMISSIFAPALTHIISMCITIYARDFLSSFWMSCAISLCSSSYFIRICLYPCSLSLPYFIVFSGAITPSPITGLFSVTLIIVLSGFVIAYLAARSEFIVSCFSDVEELFSGKKFGTTLSTASKGIGDIQHNVSLSLSRLMMSADGASDRRSVISLADTYIVSRKAG